MDRFRKGRAFPHCAAASRNRRRSSSIQLSTFCAKAWDVLFKSDLRLPRSSAANSIMS